MILTERTGYAKIDFVEIGYAARMISALGSLLVGKSRSANERSRWSLCAASSAGWTAGAWPPAMLAKPQGLAAVAGAVVVTESARACS